MNIYLIIILAILAGDYLLNLTVETLNIANLKTELPKEYVGYYDRAKYEKSQAYLKEGTRFFLFKNTFFTLVIISFIVLGGFNLVDEFARGFNKGPILTGLIFAAIIMLGTQLLGVPFAAYRTFVIEEKYGFNRTSVKTFIQDRIKMWTLGALIGGIIFAGVIWFFRELGSFAWIYCWVGVTIVQLFLSFIAPVLIMPLFNKFIPLEEGDLKKAIEQYAASQNFKMKGIFKIDASRRSSKSNAFFTGFGKYRRIGLFDTLIEKQTVGELVSVLAHEVGHYKKNHIIKDLLVSFFVAGVMFFILSLFINNAGLFAAFKMKHISVYASLFFFGFLYTPINIVFSVITNIISRRHEFEADRFAVTTYKKAEDFITALKKLTVDNLSNLSPHPLKVFMEYSHPPVLKRIEVIRSGKFNG